MVIYLFEKFEFFLSKITCLNEEIRRELKLSNFNKVIQITKIVKFEIHLKRKEIEISQFFKFLIV